MPKTSTINLCANAPETGPERAQKKSAEAFRGFGRRRRRNPLSVRAPVAVALGLFGLAGLLGGLAVRGRRLGGAPCGSRRTLGRGRGILRGAGRRTRSPRPALGVSGGRGARNRGRGNFCLDVFHIIPFGRRPRKRTFSGGAILSTAAGGRLFKKPRAPKIMVYNGGLCGKIPP